jgi:hypothetical protein
MALRPEKIILADWLAAKRSEIMAETNSTQSLRWGKALANGLYAWLLGFVLYLIPAFVVAFKMGFELGPKGVPSAEISSQISRAIPTLYKDSIWLGIGYTVVVALLVFWRAHVAARGTGNNSVKLGLMVAAVPVLLSLVSLFALRMDLPSLFNAVIFCAAGYIGGRSAQRVQS